MSEVTVLAYEGDGRDSRVLGRVSGLRMPTAPYDFQAVVSPDGAWLAMPLHDGSTSNLWTLSTRTGELRQVTEFGDRNMLITRRVGWSQDSAYLYASVSEVESDIVMLAGALGL